MVWYAIIIMIIVLYIYILVRLEIGYYYGYFIRIKPNVQPPEILLLCIITIIYISVCVCVCNMVRLELHTVHIGKQEKNWTIGISYLWFFILLLLLFADYYECWRKRKEVENSADPAANIYIHKRVREVDEVMAKSL